MLYRPGKSIRQNLLFIIAIILTGLIPIAFNSTTTLAAGTPPVVAVNSPNGGEFLAGGEVYNITWTVTDDNLIANPITIEYYDDSTWVEIATSEANDSLYEWTVPSLDISTAKVRVTAVDLDANSVSDESDADFTIDSTNPSVTLISPVGGEYWAGGSSQTITWTATDDNMNDNPITLEYFNGSAWVEIATVEPNDGSYAWTVPGLEISNSNVRVTAADKAGNTGSDESDADFTIDSTNPSVTVISPDGDEYWAGGSIQTITWTAADDNMDDNPITLEYFNGSAWVEIATAEPDEKSYDWTIPDLDIPNASIRVTAADKAGNTGSDESDAGFTIDSTVPSVVVTSPDGDEYWAGGSGQTITWTAADDNMNDNPITLEYFNGSAWVEIATVEPNDGSYAWTVPGLEISNSRVRVTASDKAGNSSSDESDAGFTIDSTVPSVAVTSPDGGEYWAGGSSRIITWTATDNNLDDNPITLEYFNGSAWVELSTAEPNDGGYTWTVPSLEISNSRVRVTVTDKVGNTNSDESNADFTIDSTAPEVSMNDIAEYINALPSINGTAADTLPGEIESVQIQINDTTVNKYWAGDSWENTPIWLNAAETVDWSYDTGSITFIDGNTYSITARSIDRAGNESTESSDGFIFDTTCPTLTLNEIPDLVSILFISGTASDTLPGLLDKVEMQIIDTNDDTYWNGSFWINGEPWLVAAGMEGWSYDTNDITFADGGTYTIIVKSIDKAGNESTEISENFTFDTTYPTVTNVSSPSSDGTYNPGDDIEITITFSEKVNVTGTPYLELDMEGNVRKAIYKSGDGTNTLVFKYTIQAGDISSDLDYVDSNSLKVDSNVSAITDTGGNNADLTLAAPGSEGSLGANKALVIEEEAQDSNSLWIILISVCGCLGIFVVTGRTIIKKQKLVKEKS